VTKSTRLPVLIISLAAMLAACDPQPPSLNPRISDVSAGNTIQGVPPEVSVTMVLPGASNKHVRNVSAEFRSTLEPDRPFVLADGEFTRTNLTWTGLLPALNVGPYEVRVTVNLRAGPNPDGSVAPPIDEFITSNIVALNVTADSEECFSFASSADDTQGWTHGGFVLVENNQPVNACPAELFWLNGMLWAGFGPNCLPAPQFRFDMVSPDLSARPGWSLSQGVVFRAGWNVPKMDMQPILVRADGLNALIPVDDSGEPVFFPMTVPTGNLQQHRVPINFTEGTVEGFRVRYFGAPLSTGNEAFARLGSVCPIPDRPG